MAADCYLGRSFPWRYLEKVSHFIGVISCPQSLHRRWTVVLSLVVVRVGVSGTCLKGNCLGKVLQRRNEMFGLGKKFYGLYQHGM